MEDANDAQANGLHGPVRALTLAVAEMYVQGVSTRKVTNEASLPGLASAVLSEISDEREIERPSMNMEAT